MQEEQLRKQVLDLASRVVIAADSFASVGKEKGCFDELLYDFAQDVRWRLVVLGIEINAMGERNLLKHSPPVESKAVLVQREIDRKNLGSLFAEAEILLSMMEDCLEDRTKL